MTSYLMSSQVPERTGSGAPYATPNEAYRTADGFVLVAAYQDAHWTAFCGLIGRPDLAHDPAYADLSVRLKNRAQLTTEINEALGRHTTTHWLNQFDGAGLICAPIADYEMVAGFDQIRHMSALATCDHATAGRISMPGFSIGGPSLAVRQTPPLLGEHNGLSAWPDAD